MCCCELRVCACALCLTGRAVVCVCLGMFVYVSACDWFGLLGCVFVGVRVCACVFACVWLLIVYMCGVLRCLCVLHICVLCVCV